MCCSPEKIKKEEVQMIADYLEEYITQDENHITEEEVNYVMSKLCIKYSVNKNEVEKVLLKMLTGEM